MDNTQKLELILKPALANISEAGKKSGHFLTFSVTFTITGLAIYISNIHANNGGNITLSFMNLSLPPVYACLIIIVSGAAMLYKSLLMNLYETYLIRGILDDLPEEAITEKFVAHSIYPIFRNFVRISNLSNQIHLKDSSNHKITFMRQFWILRKLTALYSHSINILLSQTIPLILAITQVFIIFKLTTSKTIPDLALRFDFDLVFGFSFGAFLPMFIVFVFLILMAQIEGSNTGIKQILRNKVEDN